MPNAKTRKLSDDRMREVALAKIRGSSAALDRAKSLVEAADRGAMKALEEGAEAVLRASSIATEYVQAMGSWSFSVSIPLKDGRFFDEKVSDVGDDLRRLRDLVEYDEVEPAYERHIESFIVAVEAFGQLHADYEDIFGNTAAGAPFRVDSRGKVRREW